MSTTRIVLPGSVWQVSPDDAEGLVPRLEAAGDAGRVLVVRVLDEDGRPGELVVAPAAVPVVVLDAVAQAPLEGFPQKGDLEDLPVPLPLP